jgi:hypothetical protein
MFPAWRLRLREAKLAFQEGRLDEAGDLLAGELREYLPGKRLSEKVAGQMAERARDRILAGETSAGWRDLETAERLADGTRNVKAIRESLLAQGLSDVQACLGAGDAQLAMTRLAKMEHHGRLTSLGRRWKEVARLMQEAKQNAARGHFNEALDLVQTAETLLPAEHTAEVASQLRSRTQQLAEQSEQFRQLNQALHQALANQDFSQVLAKADQMLSLAPASSIAQDARRKAWDAVGMKTTQAHRREPARHVFARSHDHRNGSARSTHASAGSIKVDTVTERAPAERWLLWVDGIGGFLIIHGEEIAIGQPAGQAHVDLPIQADISRRHAVVRRDGGAYVLDGVQETHVDGRLIDGPLVLADNNLIVLGDNVKLRFRKPHALSATARLEIESNHKTQPRADGVILMADTLVLGPKSHSHIRCREWANDVILFRRGEGLCMRTTGKLHIDGEAFLQHGPIAVGSQVEGEDFSLSLEAV